MKLHQRIKSIRETKKISQEAIAFNLELNQSQYSRRERGETKFTPEEILILSKLLNTPVSELFNETGNSKAMDDPESAIHYASVLQKLFEQYEFRITELHGKLKKQKQLYEGRLKEKDEIIALLKK